MLRDRGKTMFDATDLSALDSKYFSIIFTDAFDVTVMIRNTGHYWFIHNPEYPTPGTCIIFHKHKASHPYHQHGRASSLKQAVRSIKSHDRWQMKGWTYQKIKIEYRGTQQIIRGAASGYAAPPNYFIQLRDQSLL